MVRSLIQRFYSIMSARIGRVALQVLITPFIVRILGPAAYGDYVFVISVLAMIMVVPNGGVLSATRKYIAERRDVANWETDVFAFYARVLAVFVVVVGVVAAIGVLTGIIGRLGGQFVVYTILLVALVATQSFLNVARNALMAFKREHVSEPLFAAQMLLTGVVGLPLAYLGWGVAGLLVGHVLATVVVLVVMFRFLAQHVSITRIIRPVEATLPVRELLSFSHLSVVLSLLMQSLFYVDILFIWTLIGQEATGYYKAALLVAEFLLIVPLVLQQLLLHSGSELWAREKYDAIQTLSAKVTRYTLLLTILLGMGIGLLAEEFIGLYFGPGFNRAVLPLLILLPGTLGFAIARGVFSIGHSKGEMTPLILATAGAAALNLALNITLIPRYGMIGAAAATSISYGSMFFFHIWAARVLGFDPIADLRLVPAAITSLVTVMVLVAIESVVVSDLLALLVVPPVGFVAFSVLAVKTGALDADEIRYMTKGLVESVSS